MKRASSPRKGQRDEMAPAMLSLAVISFSALLVLSIAHMALLPHSGSGGVGGGSRVRVRLLLQGTFSIADAYQGPHEAYSEQPQTLGLRHQRQPVQPTLDLSAESDLATYDGPGTRCIITPTVSKVALLFLTHGDLPHDQLWTAWMREARGLLPRASLAGEGAFCLRQCDAAGNCEQQCGRAAACNPLCMKALRLQMGPARSPSVLQQQHLYSVYVHARPTLRDYPEGSVFAGRLIPDRVMAKWGSHSLAVAAKKLVEVAVLDKQNAWFVLVGDTTVPLYHPAMMWQQLMHESKSRVDSCWHEDQYLMRRRYSPDMRSPRFDPAQHWRKSSQWFMLNRRHAELVSHDQEVAPLFGKYCSIGWDAKLQRYRDCISDEHYIPSLLAMYGEDNQTTCDMTGGTFASWEGAVDTKEGAHPKVYQPGHITPELFNTIRLTSVSAAGSQAGTEVSELCSGWAHASHAALAGFIDAGRLQQQQCAVTLGSQAFLQHDRYAEHALDPHCVMLARKFSKPAARWVHKVYRSCSAGLGVLPCSVRLTDRDRHWWA